MVIQEPVRLASAIMPPFASPAISAESELAVIDLIRGRGGIDVELPPLTGYSVSAGPGSPKVITLSGPYQVTVLNVVVSVAATKKGESTILVITCPARTPACQSIAPKLRSVPPTMIATRTPSGATRSAVNGPVAWFPSESVTFTVTGWPCGSFGRASPRTMTIWSLVVAHRLSPGFQLIVVYPVPFRFASLPPTGPMYSAPPRRA